MSDTRAGQPSERTPDFIPGWFSPRIQPIDPSDEPGAVVVDCSPREAVRFIGTQDFPINFLRSSEMVFPAPPPQLGVCVGERDSSIGMCLAVPPGYWIVRDADGDLANWRDEDFKEKWLRNSLEWTPPVEREEADRLASATAEFDARTEAERIVREPEPVDRVLEKVFGGERPAWAGEPPAEGTRRRLILDTIERTALSYVPSRSTILRFVDAIEEALIRVNDQGATPESGSPASVAPWSVAMDLLDRFEVPRTREGAILTIADRVTVLADQLVELRRDRTDVDRLNAIAKERWQRIGELEERLEKLAGFTVAQRDSHHTLREKDLKYTEYHRGAELAYGLIVERLGGESAAVATGQVYPKGSPERRLIERGGKEAVLRDIAAADEVREADAQEAINAVGEALDRLDAPQAPTFAGRIDRLYEELRVRVDQARYLAREGKVPAGTRELHVVIASQEGTPEQLFVELENQDGVGVGGFERRYTFSPDLTHIVIPYGRDDDWVLEVAYQAAGAATRPLLEDHPDYVFPSERVSEAVAELLRDFNIEVPQGYGNRLDCAEKGEDVEEAVNTEESEEAWGHRMLEEREQARAGESRFAEERDCAFALLRWLLPVTVAKRID